MASAEKDASVPASPRETADGEVDPQYAIFARHFRHPDRTLRRTRSLTGGESGGTDEQDGTPLASPSLFELLAQAVGELTSVSVPISYLEPTSFLQRFAEVFEYATLLDQAVQEPDADRRMALIGAFVISQYSSTERTGKPLNPLLGETYELVSSKENGPPYTSNFRLVAEQVSHHPPVAASYCEGSGWRFWEHKGMNSKFRGNTVDVTPYGAYHCELLETGDSFTWKPICCHVHNIIVGSMWIDHSGELTIRNDKTGATCKLFFHPCGWMSRNRWAVTGEVFDEHGALKLSLEGHWNSSVRVVGEETPLWQMNPMPDNKYHQTTWAQELCTVRDANLLNFSDSRLRPDRLALEHGEKDVAGKKKNRLELEQRDAKKLRAAKGVEWHPRFFKPSASSTEDGPESWEYIGGFWEQRAKLEKLQSEAVESAVAASPASPSTSAAAAATATATAAVAPIVTADFPDTTTLSAALPESGLADGDGGGKDSGAV